jgi:hypothetical protein
MEVWWKPAAQRNCCLHTAVSSMLQQHVDTAQVVRLSLYIPQCACATWCFESVKAHCDRRNAATTATVCSMQSYSTPAAHRHTASYSAYTATDSPCMLQSQYQYYTSALYACMYNQVYCIVLHSNTLLFTDLRFISNAKRYNSCCSAEHTGACAKVHLCMLLTHCLFESQMHCQQSSTCMQTHIVTALY